MNKIFRFIYLLIALNLCALLFLNPSLALDQNRKFSQYSHDLRETDAGLPHNSINATLHTNQVSYHGGTIKGVLPEIPGGRQSISMNCCGQD